MVFRLAILFILIVFGVLLFLCKSNGAQTELEEYRELYNPLSDVSYEEFVKKLPYKIIEMERTVCFGWCPSYKISLFNNGEIQYEGREYVEKIGKYKGKVDILIYGRLCYLLDKVQFRTMEEKYEAPWSDDATTIVSVQYANSDKIFSVSDYGEYGPIELWGIHLAIDGIATGIDWTPVP